MSEAGKEVPSSVPVPAAPQPAVPPAAPALISLQDFQKIALRLGTVLSAEYHPKADRLLVLKVDLGEPTPRQLVAGIRTSYEPAQIVGKQVVVVANLQPAQLRGVESQGMVLAVSDASGISLLSPDRALTVGSVVK